MKLVYPVYFYPLEDQEGYCVEVPDLPGCITQGDSLTHAIEMAVDAASGWVLDELEDGNPLPSTTKINEPVPDDVAFSSLIVLDMDSYAEKHGNKSVRKNLTIPAWLATIADRNNINYSQTLQNALISELQINQKAEV